MTYYQTEIFEQPQLHENFIRAQCESIEKLAARLKEKAPKFILIAARGTSDNAATYAKYLFSSMLGIPTGLAIPSLYTIYEKPPRIIDGLVVGISQSGRGTDILAVIEQARAAGTPTLAITNDTGSPIAEAAEFAIDIQAGKEKAVAASKTYTGQMMAIAQLTAAWMKEPNLQTEISHVPQWEIEALEQHPAITDLARWIADANRIVVLARGYNHCVSYETALKIKELAYISADPYSAADFRHGPIAMLEKDFPVIAIAPQDKTSDDMKDVVRAVKELGVRLGVISNEAELLAESPHAVTLPQGIPGWLSPIIATIPGQLVALELAQARSLDVDHPQRVEKGYINSLNTKDSNMADEWSRYLKCINENRETMVQLTQQLVRLPSDTNEKACQVYIRDWLEDNDISSDMWNMNQEELLAHPAYVETGLDYSDRPNLVATLKGEGGGRSLSLLGHIDVVPVEEAEKWVNQDPWSGALVDGKIYGRGSVDMKGGLAIGLVLAAALKQSGIKLKGDLILQSVIDEENGGNGTLGAILRGYRADASIFLEPSEEDFVGISGRGAQFFRITVPGVGGGIEYQYEMPNAISKAILLYQAVERYSDVLNARAKHPSYQYSDTKVPCAICKIHAGNWPSTTPAYCQMEGSIECLPGEDIEKTKVEFKEYLLKVANQDGWLAENLPKIEYFGLRYESAEIPEDAPLVTCLRKASQEVLGKDIKPMGGGGSDLRLLVLHADSPCVLYGPKGGAIHSTNEFVDVESMMRVALVTGKAILDWCGVA